jgi:hypothetical protein
MGGAQRDEGGDGAQAERDQRRGVSNDEKQGVQGDTQLRRRGEPIRQ